MMMFAVDINAKEDLQREAVYELWENEPAPNRGADYKKPKDRGLKVWTLGSWAFNPCRWKQSKKWEPREIHS